MLCCCCCKHRLRNEKCVSRLSCLNYAFAIVFWVCVFFVKGFRCRTYRRNQRPPTITDDIRSWYLNGIDIQFGRLWKAVEQHLCRIGYGSCICDGDLRIDHVRGNAFVNKTEQLDHISRLEFRFVASHMYHGIFDVL